MLNKGKTTTTGTDENMANDEEHRGSLEEQARFDPEEIIYVYMNVEIYWTII